MTTTRTATGEAPVTRAQIIRDVFPDGADLTSPTGMIISNLIDKLVDTDADMRRYAKAVISELFAATSAGERPSTLASSSSARHYDAAVTTLDAYRSVLSCALAAHRKAAAVA